MTEYVDTREGWRKIAKDEPIAGGEEQVHRYWLKRPVDSMLQVDIWVKDPDYTPPVERPVLLSDGERVHIHDAIQEYLAANDIPEESQGWWASITLKLLEGVEDGEAPSEAEEPVDATGDDLPRN